MTRTTETQDRVEHTVEINAPLDRVWALVSTPGWWLGDGPDNIRHPPADTERRYPIRVVESCPHDYCSFRWAPMTPDSPVTEGNSTLIEFFLAEAHDTVTVRVVESGFATLVTEDETSETGVRDITCRTSAAGIAAAGWEEQLRVLREATEAA